MNIAASGGSNSINDTAVEIKAEVPGEFSGNSDGLALDPVEVAAEMPSEQKQPKANLQQLFEQWVKGELEWDSSSQFNLFSPSDVAEDRSLDVIGHVEAEAGYRVRGWILQRSYPLSPVDIEIWVDGKLWWSGPAQRNWFFESGAERFQLPLGFSVNLPDPQPQTAAWTVEVFARLRGEKRKLSSITVDLGCRFVGFVDATDFLPDGRFHVRGWAYDAAKPFDAVRLNVLSGDRIVASGVAGELRPDLKDLGYGSGRHGFNIFLSPGEAAGIANVSIEAAANGQRLSGHEATTSKAAPSVAVRHKPQPLGANAIVGQIAGNAIGFIDRGNYTEIVGWARSAQSGDPAVQLDLLINNHLFMTTFATTFRADLKDKFEDHGFHGFRFEFPQTFRPLEPLEIRVVPRNASGELKRSPLKIAPTSKRVIDNIGADRAATEANAYRPPRRDPKEAATAESPLCAFIVLNRNGAALLEEFFASFQNFNTYENLEFIIIDHGSDDDSASVCDRWASTFNVKFVPRGRNYSFSESNNFGARLTKAKYLFFANNDVSFLMDMVPPAVAMLRDPKIGILGFCLLDAPVGGSAFSPPLIQHLGVHCAPVARDRTVFPIELRFLPHTLNVFRSAWKVPVVTGALFACSKSDFEALGGFSELYFYGLEDVDLCLAASFRLGKEVVCANQIQAFHLRGYSRQTPGMWSSEAAAANRNVLDHRFGYLYRRQKRADLLGRPAYWSSYAPRIAFAVTQASADATAGDYFTAKELADELVKLVNATIVYLEVGSDWYDLTGIDILITMRHDYDFSKVVGGTDVLANVLKIGWARNWFDKWGAGDVGYDVLWASSTSGAEYLRKVTGLPVEVLPIATNATCFNAGVVNGDLSSDYCFTGSYWNSPRDIMHELDPAALPFRFAVFGGGWDEVASLAPYWRGKLPYDRMVDVYTNTKVVIDDANIATKQWGSVNSRVFDAIACGALVISNGVDGASELFSGLLPTYRTRQELEGLLWHYLTDENARTTQVAKLRAKVLGAHTYRHRAKAAFEFMKSTGTKQLRLSIKIGAPNSASRNEWGDYHFAVALKKYFNRLGHSVRIDCLDAWYGAGTLQDDVVLVLRGLSRYTPRKDQINLAWVISHPKEISVAELESFDHVFVASEFYAAKLEKALSVPVSRLLQCTDAEIFNDNVSSPSENSEVLFVGNSRKVFRPVVRSCFNAGLNLSVYGKGWSGYLPQTIVKGEYIENAILSRYYRHAGVVLNDHWDDMREEGFISNRLFDCAASGAHVVSDEVAGMRELFGDLVKTYGREEDIPAVVKGALQKGDERRADRTALAERIRRDHSYEARVNELMRVIGALDSERLSSTAPATAGRPMANAR